MSKFINPIALILLPIFFGTSLQMFAQGGNNPISKITIASPTAASLGKYGDIEVGYHTGIPQISIPIYTVSSGALSLPISLSYHASGLKVQEPASWVGAGWALNAGGVITRTVIGSPDEGGELVQEKGHYKDYGYNNYLFIPVNCNPGNAPPPTNDCMEADDNGIATGKKDGEPDLFFFNFGKFTGKFYFRDDRTPVLVPEQDIKIEVDFNVIFQGFIITTPDGVKYFFGKTGNQEVINPIETTRLFSTKNGLNNEQPISSWYLNKIESADGLSKINLSYVQENYSYYTTSKFYIKNTYDSQNPYEYDLIKNNILGVRLNKISFSNGSINFIPNTTPRIDLAAQDNDIQEFPNTQAKSLSAIQIMNSSNLFCKQFNLIYNYFTDNNSPLTGFYNNINIQTDKNRLRLDNVQEISCDGSVTKKPYSFTYFSEQVPRLLSMGQDHWGYSNGVVSNTRLLPTYTEDRTLILGANRDPIWPAMRGGALQKITYPTGGYTDFEFEPHDTYASYNTENLIPVATTNIGYDGNASPKILYINGAATDNEFNVINNTIWPCSVNIYNTANSLITTFLISANTTKNNITYLQNDTYKIILSLITGGNPNSSGSGAQLAISQWNTVSVALNKMVGGLRIKKITTNDCVTSTNLITSYDYTTSEYGTTKSTGILYGRPTYVQVLRNDLAKNVPPSQNVICSINGCAGCDNMSQTITLPYYKSGGTIRPMASSQGYHIGYSQVKVTKTNNGTTIYKYYGTPLTSPWEQTGDIAILSVKTNICNSLIPNFPPAPLPFEFLRGELKYEAKYSETGKLLNEKNYSYTFVENPIKTPGLIASALPFNPNGGPWWGTMYELKTAKKTQTSVIEKNYDEVGNVFTTTNTSYYESPFHNEITRTVTDNLINGSIENKIKYAFDFRLSTFDSIFDCSTSYLSSVANATSIFNGTQFCNTSTNNFSCRWIAFQQYRRDLSIARNKYVNCRKANFTDANNNFQTYHTTAKNSSDALLKPILQLQDDYQNPVIETSQWRNGNLLSSMYSSYDYNTSNISNKVYLGKVQSINPSNLSSSFISAATNGSNNSVVKDNRYTDETFAKFYNGNLAEIISKDGVATAYLWGYNNSLLIAKAIGVRHATLLSAYNAVGNNIDNLRTQSSLSGNGVQLNTYKYNPLVGITTETDVNGKSINYEYDKLQRVSVIRDFNNKILKQYNYKYQCNQISITPQWFATGNTKCKPCPSNANYITNIMQQEEKDNNPSSSTYNTLRWVDIGISNNCVSNADWQNTATAIRCKQNGAFQLTGELEQEQMDMNPCSNTYSQLQWVVVGYNTGTCPTAAASCNSSNCSGVDKKCVAGNCQTGQKIYTASFYFKGKWLCTYHYIWSDNTVSGDYTETSSSPCTTVM